MPNNHPSDRPQPNRPFSRNHREGRPSNRYTQKHYPNAQDASDEQQLTRARKSAKPRASWNDLPAEIRQRIWFFLTDYYGGKYSTNVQYYSEPEDTPVSIPELATNRPSQGYPLHALALVNRTFADDGRQIWPHLQYNVLVLSRKIRYAPSSAFWGIKVLNLSMFQAIHCLRTVIPHLPPDYTKRDRSLDLHITFLDIPYLRHLTIDYTFGHASDLTDAAIRTALWRLQAFHRAFYVGVYFTNKLAGGRYDVCAHLYMPFNDHPIGIDSYPPNYDLNGYNLARDWNIDWNIHQLLWKTWWLGRSNTPQRDAIIGAHSHYASCPLGWQEGRETFFPNTGVPHPTPRLPPRLHQARPWDYPPKPDTFDYDALADMDILFQHLSTQSFSSERILQDLAGWWERVERGDDDGNTSGSEQ